MKTKFLALASLVIATFEASAQTRTTVTATSTDISNNLDLRAVASAFGDSRNLEDFENKLNDPSLQLSNLDLNGDNQVDYLRVIESVEGYEHLIIIQAVLEKDVFQDIATVEIEKNDNAVQVQVVGNNYIYGENFIYEPVYVTRPVIYDYFWVSNYHPYYSSWYWNYYPSHYYVWAPFSVYHYRNHIHRHINVYNQYNYVTIHRNPRYYSLGANYRASGYATRHPERSFSQRNNGVRNSYELQQSQPAVAAPRQTRANHSNNANANPVRSAGVRTASNSSGASGNASNVRVRQNHAEGTAGPVRNVQPAQAVETRSPQTASPVSPRPQPVRSEPVRQNVPVTSNEVPRAQPQEVRQNVPQTRSEAPRASSPRPEPQQVKQNPPQTRNETPASGGSRSETRRSSGRR